MCKMCEGSILKFRSWQVRNGVEARREWLAFDSSLWPVLRLRHLPGLMPSPSSHPRDPLHGVTLETMVRQLVGRHGWEEMGWRIPIRCFQLDPSVKSSLTFLRKTPWARKKVEAWFAEEAGDAAPEAKEGG